MCGSLFRADLLRVPNEDRFHGDGRHSVGGVRHLVDFRIRANILPHSGAASDLRLLRSVPVQRVPNLRHATDDRRRPQVLDFAGRIYFRRPQHLPGHRKHFHLHFGHFGRNTRLKCNFSRFVHRSAVKYPILRRTSGLPNFFFSPRVRRFQHQQCF